jgi:hypothetical protein
VIAYERRQVIGLALWIVSGSLRGDWQLVRQQKMIRHSTYFYCNSKDPYLRSLRDGRVLPRDGKRAWYIRTHRFLVPLPPGRVLFRSIQWF